MRCSSDRLPVGTKMPTSTTSVGTYLLTRILVSRGVRKLITRHFWNFMIGWELVIGFSAIRYYFEKSLLLFHKLKMYEHKNINNKFIIVTELQDDKYFYN